MHHVSLRVWSPRALARTSLMIAVLIAGSLSLVAASAPSARTPAKLKVAQLEFPTSLVAPGERVEVGYDTRKLPSATGFLYVRNDSQGAFTRVALRLRKASPNLQQPGDELRVLRGVVPSSVVRGHRLFYYAVVHDPKSGRSVRVPAGLESVHVLTGAQLVKLGTHRFGQLRAPEAVVANASPKDVAIGVEGVNGPDSFLIAADRSVWLLDVLNKRLLVWPPGKPNARPRTISSASLHVTSNPGDFALGPAGSLYVFRGWRPRAGSPFGWLSRVTAGGRLLWRSRTASRNFNDQLRLGPDGTLYWVGPVPDRRTYRSWGSQWFPVATPAGRPLSAAQQLGRMLRYEPLPGGLRLLSTTTRLEKGPCGPVPHEMRYALANRAGRLLRAWRITSQTWIQAYTPATPAIVGGDPVVVLRVGRPAARCASVEAEYLVLRLARSGPTRTPFALAAASEEGKDLSGRAGYGLMITDVRIGPGAKLYQLGSSPTVGLRIRRFSLAAGK